MNDLLAAQQQLLQERHAQQHRQHLASRRHSCTVVLALHVSPHHALLFAATYAGDVHVFDLYGLLSIPPDRSITPSATFHISDGPIHSLASTSALLFTGGDDAIRASVHDEGGVLQFSLPCSHPALSLCVGTSYTWPSRLYSAHSNGHVLCWDLYHQSLIADLADPASLSKGPSPAALCVLCVHPDLLLCSTLSGHVLVYRTSPSAAPVLTTTVAPPGPLAPILGLSVRPSPRSPSPVVIVLTARSVHRLLLPSLLWAPSSTVDGEPAGVLAGGFLFGAHGRAVWRLGEAGDDRLVRLRDDGNAKGSKAVFAAAVLEGERGPVDDLIFVAGRGDAIRVYSNACALQTRVLHCS